MLWWGKKKPKTDAEVLLDALAGVGKREKQKVKARKRKAPVGWRRYADSRILIGLAIVLAAIVADGVRRENREFEATVTAIQGKVSVADTEWAMPRWAALQQRLTDGNVVRTAERSSATLGWPDGSLLIVGPDSQMTVKLMEYSRGGGWRGRAFYVKLGHVLAKVAPGFGKQSELKIYTPASVAAVRGTVFSVTQNRQGTEATIACADGTVRTSGLVGYPMDLPGGMRCDIRRGQPATRPIFYTRDEQKALGFGTGALWEPPPNASRLQIVEYAVNQMLAGPLTVLGIGKCGWAFGAIDATRRTAALEALRRLRLHLEGSPEYPGVVNIATLEELMITPKERNEILTQFNGFALERYICVEYGRSFVMYVRARDKARTMYKLTPAGPERVGPEEAAQIL